MSRRRWVLVVVPVAVAIVTFGVGLALRTKATKPSYARGGPFQRGEAPATPTPTAPAPSPSGTTAPSPSPSTAPSPSPSPSRVPAGARRGAETPAPAPEQPAAPATLGVPAEGVYHYRLEGSESIAGLSRPFPSTATVSVHGRRQTAGGTELTFDVTYLPGGHEGRLISTYGPNGVATSFEGGTITFLGLLSQSSQANYTPALVRTPYPSRSSWSGSSDAHDPSTGAVSRTERYDGSFVGAETIEAAGRTLDTLVYEVRSTFSGSESGTRVLRYWLDPASGMWVRWTEKIHGERGPLVYEEQATLTLQDGPL